MFKTVFKNRVQNHVQNHVQNGVQNCGQNRAQNRVLNRVQNRVQTLVQNRVQNRVGKIKYIANTNMSFLKYSDPKTRDFIVNEFLKIRQSIQQNFLSERAGDVNTQYEISKLFKPVMDMQKDLKEDLANELKPIREGMKHLPKAVTFSQFPSITAYDDDDEEEVNVFIGDIAEQYLRKFASKSGTDKTFGLRNKYGKFYIENKEAKKRKTI